MNLNESKKLKVLCECKNVVPAGQFICSVDPDKDGNYTWLLHRENGETFGGKAASQQAALEAVREVLSETKRK